MDSKYSQHIKGVLNYSKEEAVRLGTPVIGLEHLLLGILRDGEGEAVEVLQQLGADFFTIRKALEDHIKPDAYRVISETEEIPLTKATERVLKLVFLEAKSFKSSVIKTEHLLLAILKEENAFVTQMLSDMNIDYLTVRNKLEDDIEGITDDDIRADFASGDDDERMPFGGQEQGPGGKAQQSSKSNSETPDRKSTRLNSSH